MILKIQASNFGGSLKQPLLVKIKKKLERKMILRYFFMFEKAGRQKILQVSPATYFLCTADQRLR